MKKGAPIEREVGFEKRRGGSLQSAPGGSTSSIEERLDESPQITAASSVNPQETATRRAEKAKTPKVGAFEVLKLEVG